MRLRRARAAFASEEGFAMAVALGVLTVVTLLIGAAFVAAKGDINNSQHDLDSKRAYYAARAGLNSFLYSLNRNTELWEQCPAQAETAVRGSSTQTYAYEPLPANGEAACDTADPVHTMIELADGSFRMKFTGYAADSQRTIVASFKRASPLDYLWYTVYETLDPSAYSNPANFQDCAVFRRDGRPSHCATINWINGDVMRGPTYTQDQYVICGTPTFGRDAGDTVASAAPGGTQPAMVKGAGTCSLNPTVNGTLQENAPFIDPPPDNSSLLAYAQSDGRVYSGKTTIALNGTTATVTTNAGTTETVDLTADPIIYVTNSSGCSSSYSPYNVGDYSAASPCGTVHVSGTYSSSLTIAAANDIVVNGSVTTNLSGTAVLGLVANNFIRVQHGVGPRSGVTQGACGSSATNVPATTHSNIRIDAAILALNHSFIVDNYDCGVPLGNLTVNGAIAQLFRGTVGTSSGGSIVTGYLKNYTYDDRFAVQQPPYLFDLASSSWRPVRETTCVDGSTDPAVQC